MIHRIALTMNDFNLIPILPELFLGLAAMGLLMVGVFNGNKSTFVVTWASVLACVLSALILMGISWADTSVMNDMFAMNSFIALAKILILVGLMFALILSAQYLYDDHMARFEFPVLVLLAGLGMMLMVSANNMLSLYIGLELQSLSLYVLAAFRRHSIKSSEAGVKYFILGALSSGMLLFGISMLYGFTGTISFELMGQTFAAEALNVGALVGMVFVLAGLAFKISAVPFHMWTPDVYQGAPTNVTALFAMVPKVAAMAILIRLLNGPFAGMGDQWEQIIYFLAVASLLVGSFAALAQDNIKRLMAYSSIGNMGYALIGVVVGTAAGVASVMTYLSIYVVMTAGVFAVLMCMRREGLSVHKISDLSGLSQNNPMLAYALAILMFSMSGLPPMAGFLGKLVVFEAAVAAEYYVLAVLGVLASVVAAYYYLRVIKVMFFDEPAHEFDKGLPFGRGVVLGVSVGFVLFFIVKPDMLIAPMQVAAQTLFAG